MHAIPGAEIVSGRATGQRVPRRTARLQAPKPAPAGANSATNRPLGNARPKDFRARRLQLGRSSGKNSPNPPLLRRKRRPRTPAMAAGGFEVSFVPLVTVHHW